MDVDSQGQLLNVLRLLGELIDEAEERLVAQDELAALQRAQSSLRVVHAAATARFRAVLSEEAEG